MSGPPVLGQLLLHDAQQIRARCRLHAFQHQVVGIVLLVGLRNVGIVDLAVAQLLFQHFHRILRNDVHRIVDLNLQNQVRSAAQIEAQVDVIAHRRKQPLAGEALRNPKDSEQEKQRDADDNRELPEKILSHIKIGFELQVSSFNRPASPKLRNLKRETYFAFTSSSVVVTASTEALVTSTTILFGGTRR